MHSLYSKPTQVWRYWIDYGFIKMDNQGTSNPRNVSFSIYLIPIRHHGGYPSSSNAYWPLYLVFACSSFPILLDGATQEIISKKATPYLLALMISLLTSVHLPQACIQEPGWWYGRKWTRPYCGRENWGRWSRACEVAQTNCSQARKIIRLLSSSGCQNLRYSRIRLWRFLYWASKERFSK